MKKKKIILYSIFAVIVVAAVIYFLCNPLSAEEIEAIQYGAQIPDKYKSKVLKDYETAMGACKA